MKDLRESDPRERVCPTRRPGRSSNPPALALSMDTRPMHTYSMGSPRCPGVRHAGNFFRFVCEERHNHLRGHPRPLCLSSHTKRRKFPACLTPGHRGEPIEYVCMGRVSMLNARAGGLLERPGRRVGHARARGSLSLRYFIPAVTFRDEPAQVRSFTGLAKTDTVHAECFPVTVTLTRTYRRQTARYPDAVA